MGVGVFYGRPRLECVNCGRVVAFSVVTFLVRPTVRGVSIALPLCGITRYGRAALRELRSYSTMSPQLRRPRTRRPTSHHEMYAFQHRPLSAPAYLNLRS